MDSTIFSSCQNEFPNENSTVILGCVADTLEQINNASAENTRDFLLVVSGAMIFFMQTGFAVLCAGAVRIKNVQNTLLKNLLDACGAAIAFYTFGKSKRWERNQRDICTPSTSVTMLYLIIPMFVIRICLCLWRTISR